MSNYSKTANFYFVNYNCIIKITVQMAAIISCFLDSRVPPQVQVDVSTELAKTIRDESGRLIDCSDGNA
jgi:hypothetical protein